MKTKLFLLGMMLGLCTVISLPANATSCDPLHDTDASCGLKSAVEAKYGEGYCATLYDLQNGGATLEVYQRYTDAGLDDDGLGYFTMEVFPSLLDDDCSIKTTASVDGLDPTYHYYHGITLAATSDITTTPGEEEFQVSLNPDEFEYTFSSLNFVEYQTRFDSNFYDESGENRYDSTTEQDYFAPGIPGLTALSIATDGTFSWSYPTEVDTDLIRADIVLYEITDDGLVFTTFTSKYGTTTSWEYYDWNNVAAGYYLLDGVTALKVYYDDVLGYDGQVNHNMWNPHTRLLVQIADHEATILAELDNATIGEDLAGSLDACIDEAEDSQDCSNASAADFEAYLATAPDAPTISKAKYSYAKWASVDGATYYNLKLKKKSGKKLFEYNNITATKQKYTNKQKKKMKNDKKYIVYVQACNEIGCSDWTSKQFKAKK
jgi:hypothetical protein